jgi:hypothetical protein
VTATATSLTTLQSQRAGLYRDGIISLPGCFEPAWADRLHEDFEAAFRLARSYPGGTISRGPERYYFAVHPEHIRGFVDLISHPAVARLCEHVLGTDYEVVELGFDVPLRGAKNQPWHRDFPSPPATSKERRLTSLAFNVSTVDVTPDLAPLEVALGTHFDDGSAFEHGMFPPPETYGRYQALASRRYPRRGDVSARTGLTVHRGTENHSTRSRAVLIIGVVASSVSPAETAVHDLQLTGGCYESLPDMVRQHLRCTVVDKLEPIVQKHDIEGLMMGG